MYRIVEYTDHFIIQRKEIVKIYWHFLGLRSFVRRKEEQWSIILKNGQILRHFDALDFDDYHFQAKDECFKWIEDQGKYPIFHDVGVTDSGLPRYENPPNPRPKFPD